MVDPQGRPYFLWDTDSTLEEFERSLREADAAGRAYLVGKLMRQAKPDDVLQFITPQEIADLWASVERYLGRSRDFWAWLLEEWERWSINLEDRPASPARPARPATSRSRPAS
jgi:hypothetical protein